MSRKTEETTRREKAQKELQQLLRRIEAATAFSDPNSRAVKCRKCRMPCYESMRTVLRRAYPMGSGTFVCNECLGK